MYLFLPLCIYFQERLFNCKLHGLLFCLFASSLSDNVSEISKVPLELAAAAEDIGLEAAKSVFREGLTAKAERGRSEGAVRTKVLTCHRI